LLEEDVRERPVATVAERRLFLEHAAFECAILGLGSPLT
jgi:hypothetical protein